jgi:hypothetical protein
LCLGAVAISSAAFVATRSIPAADRGRVQNVSAESTTAERLSDAELGNMLRAMGIEVKLDDRRYDFTFSANYNKEPWNLSMSSVLSEDGKAIWVMAWLDACPKSAADVPRTALLRLLAKNDSLGDGKFFAYIRSNNRFVLQRVVPNENLTTARFREVLQDLGASVVETYPYWAVSNWKPSSRTPENMPENRSKSAPAEPAAASVRNGFRQNNGGERTSNPE